MPSPPPPPDQSLVDDSPIERFLERAAPILAAERGINARSRVRLMAVARDVGLDDSEFDHAVRLLQRAPAQAESPSDKATEPFRRYLDAKLEQSTVKIFTPSLEGRIVAVAVDRFHLAPEQAREAIAQVTAQRGVKRFSQQDCEAYVAGLVTERLGDSEWLDDESVNRLRAAGAAQWGLSIDQVDALIVTRAAANRDRHGKEDKSSKVILTTAVVASVSIFLVLAVLVIWGNMGRRDSAKSDTGHREPSGPAAEKPIARRPPKWWNVDLALAQSQAKTSIAGYPAVYSLLSTDEAPERAKGYEQLVALASGGEDEAVSREILKQVVVGSHALDPDDAPVERLRAALLALAISENDKLPAGRETYDLSIWAVETALAALYYSPPVGNALSGIPPDKRADDLAAAIGKALGISIDLGTPYIEVERRCLGALAAALYRQLTANAADAPRRSRQLHARLAAWAQDHVKLEELERLDVNVLAAALPAAGDSWPEFEPLIAACIGSRDPLVVLKVLEIYENAKSASLQDTLAELLVLRVGARPKSSARADVAAAVREALGAVVPVAPATANDRWETLREKAKEALARRPPLPAQSTRLLEETLLLAHLATLGCALAQQEPGFALFDQLVKDGPPSLAVRKGEGPDIGSSATESGRARMAGVASPKQREDLARYLEGLARFKDLTSLQRLTFTRGLASLTERFADIAPDQAVIVARFLLGEKPEDEQKRVIDSVEMLCRWKSVRLALADLLGDPAANVKIPQYLAAALFSKALAREVILDDGWAESIREQLLRSVLADLATTTPTDEPASGHDRAAEALLELYRARAKLLGLGVAQYRSAATPSQTLDALSSHQASQPGGAARPADTKYLARLPHELAVAEYLGTNDVRRTVLAQRVWLRLLAIAVGRKRPEQAAAASALVDELAARDLKATHLLLQLHDGEAATLRMWLLHAPSGDKVTR